MTTYQIEIIEQEEHTVRFRLKKGGEYLSFEQVFALWQNAEFTRFYIEAIKKLAYKAFYWEHPALSQKYLNKKYECILHRSKPLEHLSADKLSFSDYIHNKGDVEDFMNKGENARLVIPTQKSNKAIYNHLGKFIRMADEEQIFAVFSRVGKVIVEELEKEEVVWLSTAGLGVIWLHIRMDTRPKYYKTKEYKKSDFFEMK